MAVKLIAVKKAAFCKSRRGRRIGLALLGGTGSRSISGSNRRRPTEIEPKVDPSNDRLDVLSDLKCVVRRGGPWWEAEEYVRSPEIQIIVLHEHRPVRSEHVFHAYADSPAQLGNGGARFLP